MSYHFTFWRFCMGLLWLFGLRLIFGGAMAATPMIIPGAIMMLGGITGLMVTGSTRGIAWRLLMALTGLLGLLFCSMPVLLPSQFGVNLLPIAGLGLLAISAWECGRERSRIHYQGKKEQLMPCAALCSRG